MSYLVIVEGAVRFSEADGFNSYHSPTRGIPSRVHPPEFYAEDCVLSVNVYRSTGQSDKGRYRNEMEP
jgi:hypothetical protein